MGQDQGAFRLTRWVTLYDADGGVSHTIHRVETERYFRQRNNAETAYIPGANLDYVIRWLPDWSGLVEDEK